MKLSIFLLLSYLFISCSYDEYLYPKNMDSFIFIIKVVCNDTVKYECGNCYTDVNPNDEMCWNCKHKFKGILFNN